MFIVLEEIVRVGVGVEPTPLSRTTIIKEKMIRSGIQ